MRPYSLFRLAWLGATLALSASTAHAAGTLTPIGASHAPIQIVDHHVDVVINNGFARTEVTQRFHNPNDLDLEALYAFPVPKSASLSEMTVFAGEKEIHGEVVEKDKAKKVYEEERDRGSDAGLASKNEFHTFEFRVSPVRANAETRVRFVYYQPLEIDTGVGRYLYPLEEGGTDEAAKSFWLSSPKVHGIFSMDVELKSTVPLEDVRMPGFQSQAVIDNLESGHTKIRIEKTDASLDQDFLLYYKLQDGLPGRVELLTHRDDPNGPGTFMAVVTPGLDLKPLAHGADYTFVLDVSGSMQGGKIATLADGVAKAIGDLDPDDHFRIITFSSRASELTRGRTQATQQNVEEALQQLKALRAGGSTNVYDAVALALDDLDDDRATSIVLVTDAVTNTGVVDPRAFHDLLKRYDVRVFGFLIGNSGNWPLMRTIANATGGFHAGISNADDILGQILLAKSKVTHEALHDASFEIQGVKTFDTTGELVGKIYRGQQLVLFGRYERGGDATLRLRARLTGEDKTYVTHFVLPDHNADHPELERLWALARIDEIEDRGNAGLIDEREVEPAIRDLGIGYQLVTDYTSMVVLDEAAFERHGIGRNNRERVAVEQAAQARRAANPGNTGIQRVDRDKPTFKLPAPGLGGGGGAIDPITGVIALGLVGAAAWGGRRQQR